MIDVHTLYTLHMTFIIGQKTYHSPNPTGTYLFKRFILADDATPASIFICYDHAFQ